MVSGKWGSCFRISLLKGTRSTHRVLKCHLPLTQKICSASTAAPWSRPVQCGLLHWLWRQEFPRSQNSFAFFLCTLLFNPSFLLEPDLLLSSQHHHCPEGWHTETSLPGISHIGYSTNKLQFPFLDELRCQTIVRHYTTGAKCRSCQEMKDTVLRVCVYTCKPRDESKLE